jgi:hypothetical protein
MSSIAGNRSRLQALTREILLQWEQTRGYWQDAKGAEFNHRYMEQLLLQIDRAITAGEKMDKIVNKVRNDCE